MPKPKTSRQRAVRVAHPIFIYNVGHQPPVTPQPPEDARGELWRLRVRGGAPPPGRKRLGVLAHLRLPRNWEKKKEEAL